MGQKPVLTKQQLSAFNAALETGIERKSMDMIRLALDNGAEPNILLLAGVDFKPTWKDKFNYADPWKFGLDWVTTAVEYGADVNVTRNDKKKPYAALHWSYVNFNKNVADFLIDHGASVDTPSPNGNTPLMRAVSDGDADLLKYYLGKGADPMFACGEKKDDFPLKALQGSDQFKPAKKAELIMLMMQQVKQKSAPPETPPAPPPGSDVTLSQDIEISPPVTLKGHAPEKTGKTFSL